MDSIKDTEKKDCSDLLKTSLSLSQQTYDKLAIVLVKEHLKLEDLPIPLKRAYNSFDKEDRQKAWEKGLKEGKWNDWD